MRKRISGEVHCNIATSYEGLATIYWLQEDYTKAKNLYWKCVSIREQVLGVCPVTINSYDYLAEMYYYFKDYAKAEELYCKIIRSWEMLLEKKEAPILAEYYNILADIYCQQGEIEKALNFLVKAYRTFIYGFDFGCNPQIGDMIYKNTEIVYTKWNPKGNFKQWLKEQIKE